MGVVAYVCEVGVFIVLTASGAFLEGSVLTAKAIAATVGGAAAFAGNRRLTFHSGRSGWASAWRFVTVGAVAALLGVGCLFVSHYLLGLRSGVADNVSANVVGVAVASVFRFWAYRWWVFPPPAVPPVPQPV